MRMNVRGISLLIPFKKSTIESELNKRLSAYGRVLLVEEIRKNHENSNNEFNPSHLMLQNILIVFEEISNYNYTKLLNYGIGLKNENFAVKSFCFDGLEPLDYAQIAKQEERKVCVYSIPKSYKGRKLKKIFENEFGKVVDAAFIRGKSDNLFNFGFVKFFDKKGVMEALNKNFIRVPRKTDLNDNSHFNDKDDILEIKPYIIKHSKEAYRKFLRNHIQNYLTSLKSDPEFCFTNSFFNQAHFIPEKKRKRFITGILRNGYCSQAKDFQELELFYFNRNKLRNRSHKILSRIIKMNMDINKNHNFDNILENTKAGMKNIPLISARFEGKIHEPEKNFKLGKLLWEMEMRFNR